jgi:hypothetical protein
MRNPIPISIALLPLLFPLLGCGREEEAPVPVAEGKPAVSISAKSGDLRGTVVVPTLDAPVPEGKSAVWCSTLSLAWKEYRKIEPGKIAVPDPEAAERLDAARESTSDLPAGSFYVKAGKMEEGIVEEIRREMAERFPDKTFPDLVSPVGEGSLAYAYLRAGVKFPEPFAQLPGLTFEDSAGRRAAVKDFGLVPKAHDEAAARMRKQVSVLSYEEGGDFVVDLSKDSEPSQVILAAVGLEETLGKTLERVEKLSAGRGEELRPEDRLAVPDLSFLVDHRFRELEGRDLILAEQLIRLKLGRTGVEVESEASLATKAEEKAPESPRRLVFDRPFLIVLKKRGASRPFFVMWVDNAELLKKA